MAKATGPLFSMDANGKFGGALVFGKWKGRNTIRQLVTPSNPKSTDQQASRNRMRVMAAAQKYENLTTRKGDGRALTDKADLSARAPSGQAWNGFLVKSGIGAGGLNYTNATTAYAALTGGNRTSWDAAAAALVPAITAVAQKVAGGGAGTAVPAGEVHFHQQWALYVAGVRATQPGATPPTYA